MTVRVPRQDACTVVRIMQCAPSSLSKSKNCVLCLHRTLTFRVELGLVRTLNPRRETIRYDANLDLHHHYVCVRCGLARDFESAEPNAFRIQDAVKEFGSLFATHVEARGVCTSCANEMADESVMDNLKLRQGQKRRGASWRTRS